MPIILHAEDDPGQLTLMRLTLRSLNVKLIEAVDGQEALKKIRTLFPDLILLDLFMPYVDGFGVMKALKSDPQTCNIPIIVLSAWPTGDNHNRAQQAGAADFIAKPYIPAQLIKVIKQHLSIPATSDLPQLPG